MLDLEPANQFFIENPHSWWMCWYGEVCIFISCLQCDCCRM